MPSALTNTLSEKLCNEAISWRGTPYHDHAGIKGRLGGVDCFYYPLRVYQAVGLIDKAFKPPRYSPQAWINSPKQIDKLHLRFEDTTAIDIVKKFFDEIEQADVRPGDLMVVQVVASWSHGAIVIKWPDLILHSVKGYGVIGSHGTEEGFWQRLPKRFFTIKHELIR